MKLSAGAIRLIIFDFDGVMTDNRVIVSETGQESVIVNRADGLGINIIKKLGIPMLILSTEANSVVTVRARKLDLPLLQAVEDKAHVLDKYCAERNIPFSMVLYVGNDINDLEAMKLVGYRYAPADSHDDIKSIAHHIFKAKGGDGVVRELADLLSK